jgi:hypothetical protein
MLEMLEMLFYAGMAGRGEMAGERYANRCGEVKSKSAGSGPIRPDLPAQLASLR